MSQLLIKGGRLVDPATKTDKVKDVLIENGVVVSEFKSTKKIETIDAAGLIVAPGLIDMHVHLREPGREDEETIISGANAAAAGGFTTITCMPNTSPPVDSAAVVKYISERAALTPIDVKIIGAVTKGQKGEALAEMGEMAAVGVVAFSDDGYGVADSAVMRAALEYATNFNLPIISHCEDSRLSQNGVMHEGYNATILGLKGIPAAAEEVMVARDIILAKLTGARLHIAHVSTAGSVDLIRQAKKEGLLVTCEVTPHHLVLTAECLCDYNTNYKVNPPLRSKSDVQELWRGLTDGTIDVIATDHAPHAQHEKEQEIELASFGVIGLETAVPVLFTEVEHYKIKLIDLVAKLTLNPARILGLKAGSLEEGSAGDVTVIDSKAKLEVDTYQFNSKSRNTPFAGRKLKGKVIHVFKEGKQIVKDGMIIN